MFSGQPRTDNLVAALFHRAMGQGVMCVVQSLLDRWIVLHRVCSARRDALLQITLVTVITLKTVYDTKYARAVRSRGPQGLTPPSPLLSSAPPSIRQNPPPNPTNWLHVSAKLWGKVSARHHTQHFFLAISILCSWPSPSFSFFSSSPIDCISTMWPTYFIS